MVLPTGNLAAIGFFYGQRLVGIHFRPQIASASPRASEHLA